jgi:hypothetical protein
MKVYVFGHVPIRTQQFAPTIFGKAFVKSMPVSFWQVIFSLETELLILKKLIDTETEVFSINEDARSIHIFSLPRIGKGAKKAPLHASAVPKDNHQ